MSYIHFLKIAKNYAKKPFDAYSEKDFIRIEKVLKLEQKLNIKINVKAIDFFLESIRNEKDGVSFLLSNPNLIKLLNQKDTNAKRFIGFRDNIKKSDTITSFIQKYLKEDILNSIQYYFTKKQYVSLKNLLNYKKYFHSEILEFIDAKIILKIENEIAELKKGNIKSSDIEDDFISLAEIVKTHDVVKSLKKLESYFQLEISKIIETSGFIYFFKVIAYGFSQLSKSPTSKRGIKERKEAIKELNFAISIFGGITILIIGAIVFATISKNNKEIVIAEKYKNKFSNSLYGFLTEFDKDSITNINKINTKTGRIAYYNKYLRMDKHLSSGEFAIKNNTTYDLIILSDNYDDELAKINQQCYFIKSNDSLKIHARMNRIYIGKNFAFFKSNEQRTYYDIKTKQIVPRFLNLYPFSQKMIQKSIELRGDIVFETKNEKVSIKSTRNFFIGGIPYQRYVLE